MVVLAASICTKSGKVLVSRQFLEMSRSRIEGLLASFVKLMPTTGTQHTTVATDDVRFVYQALENMYLVLTTSLKSNIIQDIATLQLFARAIADACGNRSLDEREINDNVFELLHLFDEIVSLGLCENVTAQQLRTVAAMDSNEERIQEMITKNKEMEAKEQMRLKVKQMALERKQLARANAANASMGAGQSSLYTLISGGSSHHNNNHQHHHHHHPTSILPARSPSPTGTAAAAAAAAAPGGLNLKTGMKLGGGARSNTGFSDVFGAAPMAQPLAINTMQQQQQQQQQQQPQAVYQMQQPLMPALAAQVPAFDDPVHLTLDEKILATVSRDGGLQSLEIRGDLAVHVNPGEGESARIVIDASKMLSGTQFKVHPSFDKRAWSGESALVLRDNRKFTPGQPTPALKWRLATTEENMLPIAINCWPTPVAGTVDVFDVTIEYDLVMTHLRFPRVVLCIPFAGSAQYQQPPSPPTLGSVDGRAVVDLARRAVIWELPEISTECPAGSIEFRASAPEGPAAFFPITLALSASCSVCNIGVAAVSNADGSAAVAYGATLTLGAEDFKIV